MTEDIRKLQRDEALKRLRVLKVHKDVINDFKKGIIHYSERQNKLLDGILYWIKNEQRYLDAINLFEANFGGLVYHAQLTHTHSGEWLTLLYVSKYQDDWENDLLDLEKGHAYAYVETFTYDSEFGRVGIIPKNGGVSRTY